MTNETYKIPVMQTDEHETKLRITKRGKKVLGAIALLPAVVASADMGVSVISNSIHEYYNPTLPPLSGDTVPVVPGDTLWSIADELDTGHPTGDVVLELEKANPLLAGGALMPGDSLSIPVDVAQWMQQHKADTESK